tara:strand:+ start:35347 stop:35835 length:489 start_codon:yes stop_codon:yes gene_type:complete
MWGALLCWAIAFIPPAAGFISAPPRPLTLIPDHHRVRVVQSEEACELLKEWWVPDVDIPELDKMTQVASRPQAKDLFFGFCPAGDGEIVYLFHAIVGPYKETTLLSVVCGACAPFSFCAESSADFGEELAKLVDSTRVKLSFHRLMTHPRFRLSWQACNATY